MKVKSAFSPYKNEGEEESDHETKYAASFLLKLSRSVIRRRLPAFTATHIQDFERSPHASTNSNFNWTDLRFAHAYSCLSLEVLRIIGLPNRPKSIQVG